MIEGKKKVLNKKRAGKQAIARKARLLLPYLRKQTADMFIGEKEPGAIPGSCWAFQKPIGSRWAFSNFERLSLGIFFIFVLLARSFRRYFIENFILMLFLVYCRV